MAEIGSRKPPDPMHASSRPSQGADIDSVFDSVAQAGESLTESDLDELGLDELARFRRKGHVFICAGEQELKAFRIYVRELDPEQRADFLARIRDSLLQAIGSGDQTLQQIEQGLRDMGVSSLLHNEVPLNEQEHFERIAENYFHRFEIAGYGLAGLTCPISTLQKRAYPFFLNRVAAAGKTESLREAIRKDVQNDCKDGFDFTESWEAVGLGDWIAGITADNEDGEEDEELDSLSYPAISDKERVSQGQEIPAERIEREWQEALAQWPEHEGFRFFCEMRTNDIYRLEQDGAGVILVSGRDMVKVAPVRKKETLYTTSAMGKIHFIGENEYVRKFNHGEERHIIKQRMDAAGQARGTVSGVLDRIGAWARGGIGLDIALLNEWLTDARTVTEQVDPTSNIRYLERSNSPFFDHQFAAVAGSLDSLEFSLRSIVNMQAENGGDVNTFIADYRSQAATPDGAKLLARLNRVYDEMKWLQNSCINMSQDPGYLEYIGHELGDIQKDIEQDRYELSDAETDFLVGAYGNAVLGMHQSLTIFDRENIRERAIHTYAMYHHQHVSTGCVEVFCDLARRLYVGSDAVGASTADEIDEDEPTVEIEPNPIFQVRTPQERAIEPMQAVETEPIILSRDMQISPFESKPEPLTSLAVDDVLRNRAGRTAEVVAGDPRRRLRIEITGPDGEKVESLVMTLAQLLEYLNKQEYIKE